MARVDTLNAANVANEVTVYAAANGGRRPKVLACKDATVAAAARVVVDGGTLGYFAVVVDASAALAASGWEGRDSPKARSAAAMLDDAKATERRRRSFVASGAGAVPAYGGGADNY